MTVQDLIDKLNALPEEAKSQRVMIQTGECHCCTSEELELFSHDSLLGEGYSPLYSDAKGPYLLLR